MVKSDCQIFYLSKLSKQHCNEYQGRKFLTFLKCQSMCSKATKYRNLLIKLMGVLLKNIFNKFSILEKDRAKELTKGHV